MYSFDGILRKYKKKPGGFALCKPAMRLPGVLEEAHLPLAQTTESREQVPGRCYGFYTRTCMTCECQTLVLCLFQRCIIYPDLLISMHVMGGGELIAD